MRIPAQTHVGVPWYRVEDWAELRRIFTDSGSREFQETYVSWLIEAEMLLVYFASNGVAVEKVYIEPNEFLAWCRARSCSTDADARIAFIAETVAQRSLEPRQQD